MKYLLLLLSALAAPLASAQDAAEKSAVYEPINLLFTGMNRGDSAMVRKAFMPNPVMATVSNDKDGNATMRYGDFQKFLNAVGTPHAQAWSEPVWEINIQHDGNLAQIWARYAFYVGKKFSHCGVDAFQLFKGADGKWRIFFIADTRQTEGCEVPASIRAKFE